MNLTEDLVLMLAYLKKPQVGVSLKMGPKFYKPKSISKHTPK